MITNINNYFRIFSAKVSALTGTSWAFLLAVSTIIVWLVTGPIFKFSDTWQLIINTGTTIVTFLMVFLIQNTQNRDSKAIQIKLDTLINATPRAKNKTVFAENLTDEELESLQKNILKTIRVRQKKRGPKPKKKK